VAYCIPLKCGLERDVLGKAVGLPSATSVPNAQAIRDYLLRNVAWNRCESGPISARERTTAVPDRAAAVGVASAAGFVRSSPAVTQSPSQLIQSSSLQHLFTEAMEHARSAVCVSTDMEALEVSVGRCEEEGASEVEAPHKTAISSRSCGGYDAIYLSSCA
jgi:hypothetical protein